MMHSGVDILHQIRDQIMQEATVQSKDNQRRVPGMGVTKQELE